MIAFSGLAVGCDDGAGSTTDGETSSSAATGAGSSGPAGTSSSASAGTTGSGMEGGGGSGTVDPILTEDWEAGDGAWIIEGSATIEADPAFAHGGTQSLRVDFRDPACGPTSCSPEGNNCFENYPQVVSQTTFDLDRFYVSWWVYYPNDFTFYDGPCMPVRGSGGHFVRFTNFHTPHDPNDSFYQAAMPDFGQHRAGDDHIGVRAEWQWVENETQAFSIGRNLKGLPMEIAGLAGKWNRYELYVDLGTPGASDGVVAWSVNDVVLFDVHADALHVGIPFEDWDVWGDAASDAAQHPGLLRTSPEGFTRLGLVSNPNSSFGGRPGDVYWLDDLFVADVCPADRPLCQAVSR